jgi:hypothetical protein
VQRDSCQVCQALPTKSRCKTFSPAYNFRKKQNIFDTPVAQGFTTSIKKKKCFHLLNEIHRFLYLINDLALLLATPVWKKREHHTVYITDKSRSIYTGASTFAFTPSTPDTFELPCSRKGIPFPLNFEDRVLMMRYIKKKKPHPHVTSHRKGKK